MVLVLEDEDKDQVPSKKRRLNRCWKRAMSSWDRDSKFGEYKAQVKSLRIEVYLDYECGVQG